MAAPLPSYSAAQLPCCPVLAAWPPGRLAAWPPGCHATCKIWGGHTSRVWRRWGAQARGCGRRHRRRRRCGVSLWAPRWRRGFFLKLAASIAS